MSYFWLVTFVIIQCFITPVNLVVNADDRLRTCLREMEKKSKQVFPHEVYYKFDWPGGKVFRYEYCSGTGSTYQTLRTLPPHRIEDYSDIESMKESIQSGQVVFRNNAYWAIVEPREQSVEYSLVELKNIQESSFPFGNPFIHAFNFLQGIPFTALLENGEHSINLDGNGNLKLNWRGERFWDSPKTDGVFIFRATFDLENARCLDKEFYLESDRDFRAAYFFDYIDKNDVVPIQILQENGFQKQELNFVYEIVQFDYLSRNLDNQCYLSYYGIDEPPFYRKSKSWISLQNAIFTGVILTVLVALLYLFVKSKSAR